MANFASPPESRAADAPAARPRETVGDLLKRARLEQGAEIDQIAAALRIRASHLAAIEQARYDRLPGVVYALGFVRTYANHLGLDGDEAVRRFKLESAGLEQRQDLAFPMPLTARSMPGGRLVLVAVVLAVCAYGVWHYVSTGERDRPERIAAVPTSLLPPPAPAPEAAAPGQTAPATAASAPAAEGAAPSPAPVSASPLPPPAAATDANPTASQPGASLVAPPSPQAAPAPVRTAGLTPPPAPQAGEPARPAPTTVAATPAPPAASAPADTDSNAAPATATPPSAPAEQPAPAQAAAGAATVAATTPGTTPVAAPAAPPAPRVFGAIDGPSHITLHAMQDCWIQVRDSDPAQTVIAQRTLHAGDTYRVPDKTGLTLRTGNASVLQVLVDDRAAPALGGTVHNFALDPAKLLAGNAVE